MTTPPDSLPDDARALKELLIAARDENERLIAIIKVLQRHRFGPRSEKIDPDQLALMLEDVEQAIAAAEAEAEGKREPAGTPVRRKRQINRGALPKHLPREEVVVDLADKCCPCCNRLRVKLGEDVSERLDMIPARFKVIVTRRPKYACRECDGEVAQAPAPEHLIEGGIPTEALIAAVVIAKYADHLPLYRQAQIYGRQGVELDRSTLADWSGRAAFALRPVYERLFDVLKGSDKLFADETRAPVLDPGRRKTKTGQLWAYARDDRPWGGPEPPGVAYVYEPDRKHERPATHLAGFAGCLQADGYGAYKALAEGNAVTLAFCRVGGDVASPAPHRPGRADYPHPVLHAQGSLRWRRTDERAMETAGGVARAWHGSATTTACCGGRDGQAIFSRYARPGGDTNVVACCFPRRHSRRSAPGSFATGGRAVRGRAGANCADTIPSRPRGRACNGLSPLSGARRPCPSRMFPKHG